MSKVFSEKEVKDARGSAIEIAYGDDPSLATLYSKNGLKAVLNNSEDPFELLVAGILLRQILSRKGVE